MTRPVIELDAASAAPYVEQRGLAQPPFTISELGGGVSNTVLLIETPGRRLVLKQALSKLRVEQDWFSDRERIFRESSAMRALAGYLPPGSIPEVLFEDRENFAFAMSAAPSEAQPWNSLLLSGVIDDRIAAQAGRMLAAMVSASWKSSEWEQAFGDQTVFDQLRLDPYYRATAAQNPDLTKYFERLIEETAERRVSLVHGDWSPKNFLVHGDTMVAIDFEVIHFGDPAFDSAFLLNHLLLKSFYLPEHAQQFGRLALCFWKWFAPCLPDWIESATIQHLGCLLLARVDGKSPVEYLTSPSLCDRVRNFARELIMNPPASLWEIFAV